METQMIAPEFGFYMRFSLTNTKVKRGGELVDRNKIQK
jgi:hypothetical protein